MALVRSIALFRAKERMSITNIDFIYLFNDLKVRRVDESGTRASWKSGVHGRVERFEFVVARQTRQTRREEKKNIGLCFAKQVFVWYGAIFRIGPH